MLLLITARSFTEVTVIKTETSLNVTKLDSWNNDNVDECGEKWKGFCETPNHSTGMFIVETTSEVSDTVLCSV